LANCFSFLTCHALNHLSCELYTNVKIVKVIEKEVLYLQKIMVMKVLHVWFFFKYYYTNKLNEKEIKNKKITDKRISL
jgi:hypothetical protein